MALPLALAVAGPSIRTQTRPLIAAASTAVLGVAVDLARPWPVALAIDYAIDHRSRGGLPGVLQGASPSSLLVVACIALVGLTAASGLLDMATTMWSERAAERIGADLRARIFERALDLSLRWHDRMRRGELLSRLTTDVGRLLDAVVASLTLLLPDVVLLAGVLIVLVHINGHLVFIALAVVPVLALLAQRQRRQVRAAEQDARAEAGRLAGSAGDLLSNVRAVQAFGRSELATADFARHNRDLLDVELRAVTVEARWSPLADVVLAAGTGVVLIVGGREVLSGALTTGELVVVLSYLRDLYAPIRAMCRLSSTLAKAAASAVRVGEVLDCDDAVRDAPAATRAAAPRRDIRFDGVSFAYQDGTPVLRDFDLCVAAGETICLWGPSGAGKTTLLHLLLRLYDVDGGRVLIDDLDIRTVQRHSLRRMIAFVPQDPWLLDASIAQNIAFGVQGVTKAAVLAAGRLAELDAVAASLPAGYDTPVGEAGVRLSGGQRRRIAIARAVVSAAPIVLLDEPTASLDPRSAAAVTRVIRTLASGRTVVMVTHDPELAAIADRVVTVHPRPTDVTPLERDPITQVEGGDAHVRYPDPGPHRPPWPGPLAQPVPQSQPQPRLVPRADRCRPPPASVRRPISEAE